MPLFAQWECHLWGAVVSSMFVGAFYVLRPDRLKDLSRDHPEIIKLRFVSAGLVSIIAPILMHFMLKSRRPETSLQSTLELLGLTLSGTKLMSSLKTLLLSAILFTGPLADMYFLGDLPSQENFIWPILEEPLSLTDLRAYVVAPFVEEFVFRSCLLPVFLLGPFSETSAILLVPLYFGAAHMHHAVEKAKAGHPLKFILVSTGFQFAYTTLFGWFSAYQFVSSNSFYGSWWAHIFCNIMGFPSAPSSFHSQAKRQVISALYVVGLVQFIFLTWV
ncbi:CAAX prenyl protease [Entomophthora muscae]|uniref:CAAX prenyl protease n=1 Tax=Entomophthora muscae TaxID=34485 RepID=A0ACC2UU83_9FUNG|nr:CAAX prenyl protease [Entomophthora muscae]